MNSTIFTQRFFNLLIFLAIVQAGLGSARGQEQMITLKNGMVLEGMPATKAAYIEGATLTSGSGTSLLMVDDRLRRVFTYKPNVMNMVPAVGSEELFEIDQFGANNQASSGGIGAILSIGPFNKNGQRMIRIMGPKGPVTVYQGIIEISPRYSVLRSIEQDNKIYSPLEMRISTQSIPREILSQIMRHHINAENETDRLKIVSFYQQSKRYYEAEIELSGVIKDFPEIAEEKQRELKLLRQAWANQLVNDIRERSERGQYSLAKMLIERFPRKEVASEILLEVGDIARSLESAEKRRQGILQRLELTAERIKTETALPPEKQQIADQFCQEIKSELNLNNLGRFAAYMTLSDDPSQSADQNLGLAISGWLLGSDGSIDNLEVAFSLIKVRELIIEYLSAPAADIRAGIKKAILETEGSSAKNVAAIIANLKPWIDSTPQEHPDFKALYELEAPGIGEIPSFPYLVQLPPDYDPYRRYPCVVAMSGARFSAENQIEWWAGEYDPNLQMRKGEASKYGYIVIVPQWKPADHDGYQFTAQEHASVLNPLRDAFKRFSIDTDRVFLSGQADGGTAAWDIGLAHPDLWAGVIPIGAEAEMYISRYWENARHVLPMYFVHGELDSPRSLANNTDWTRMMDRFGFDVMVVEYRGRGREHFHEEVKTVFQWMEVGSHRRNVAPEKFECSAMRPWDNFFWFVEVSDMRKNSIVLPQQWPISGRAPTTIAGGVQEKNRLLVKTTANKELVWLAPEYVDFDRPLKINSSEGEVQPDVGVLLEDVRARCDRQHPFWAVVDLSERPWKR
jgi:predicted esterase